VSAVSSWTQGYVYVVHAPTARLVKIGTALNPEKRVQTLRRMSPVPLELVGISTGGPKLEAQLHERFSNRRSHGEWFADSVLDEIGWLFD
jgi:hypothetical protein